MWPFHKTRQKEEAISIHEYRKERQEYVRSTLLKEVDVICERVNKLLKYHDFEVEPEFTQEWLWPDITHEHAENAEARFTAKGWSVEVKKRERLGYEIRLRLKDGNQK